MPDRERAESALERAEAAIRKIATLDPDAPGEAHGPLDFAPSPDSLARRLFDDATIAAHLDHLAAGQQDDGGWTFNFPAWSPAQEADWRGSFTVDALDTLRRNERVGRDLRQVGVRKQRLLGAIGMAGRRRDRQARHHEAGADHGRQSHGCN